MAGKISVHNKLCLLFSYSHKTREKINSENKTDV